MGRSGRRDGGEAAGFPRLGEPLVAFGHIQMRLTRGSVCLCRCRTFFVRPPGVIATISIHYWPTSRAGNSEIYHVCGGVMITWVSRLPNSYQPHFPLSGGRPQLVRNPAAPAWTRTRMRAGHYADSRNGTGVARRRRRRKLGSRGGAEARRSFGDLVNCHVIAPP